MNCIKKWIGVNTYIDTYIIEYNKATTNNAAIRAGKVDSYSKLRCANELCEYI